MGKLPNRWSPCRDGLLPRRPPILRLRDYLREHHQIRKAVFRRRSNDVWRLLARLQLADDAQQQPAGGGNGLVCVAEVLLAAVLDPPLAIRGPDVVDGEEGAKPTEPLVAH